MRCEKARKLLALESGGDLPGARDRALASHLEVCRRCRAFSEELALAVAWMRSAAEPVISEADYAAMRREVWRRIESGRGARSSSFGAGRLVLAAAGLLAAVLSLFLLARKSPQESPVASARPAVVEPPPAPPNPTVSSAGPAPSPAHAAEPVRVAVSRPPRSARRRPVAPAGDSAVERIEFRTANPNVRIIWLVRKGEEKSSSMPAGRTEEVS